MNNRSTVADFLDALQRDVDEWVPSFGPITLFESGGKVPIYGPEPTPFLTSGWPSGSIVAATTRSAKAIFDGDHGAHLVDEVAVVTVAEFCQDQVMDLLGEGWPELLLLSGQSPLMHPELIDGRPFWRSEAGQKFPFGALPRERGSHLR